MCITWYLTKFLINDLSTGAEYLVEIFLVHVKSKVSSGMLMWY